MKDVIKTLESHLASRRQVLETFEKDQQNILRKIKENRDEILEYTKALEILKAAE